MRIAFQKEEKVKCNGSEAGITTRHGLKLWCRDMIRRAASDEKTQDLDSLSKDFVFYSK